MPSVGGSIALSSIERFFRKVQKTDSCWLWTGSLTDKGYGRFLLNRKMVRAHRYAFELYKHKPRKGFEIHHTCDVRRCVNPEHLKEMGHRKNNSLSSSPSGLNSQKIYCIRGHKLPVSRDGRRVCLRCRTIRREIRRMDGEFRSIVRERTL